MKNRLFSLTIAVWALIYALTAHENIVYGAKDPLASLESIYYVENAPIMRKIRCTCYIGSGITASGQKTRSGIIAGKKEWLGKTVALYSINDQGTVKEFIGFYEFLDTGAGIDTDGDGKGDSLISGNSIDVWQPTLQDAKNWVNAYGDYVYMQMLESEG